MAVSLEGYTGVSEASLPFSSIFQAVLAALNPSSNLEGAISETAYFNAVYTDAMGVVAAVF